MERRPISVDTLCNAAVYFAGHWSPTLKRSQSRDVLRYFCYRFYFDDYHTLLQARCTPSQRRIALKLGISRQWSCKLIGRLADTGWLTVRQPRTHDGALAPCAYRPGPKLRKLLYMLLKSSKSAIKSHVNDRWHKRYPLRKTKRKKIIPVDFSFSQEDLEGVFRKFPSLKTFGQKQGFI